MTDKGTSLTPRAGQGILLAVFLLILTVASIAGFSQRVYWTTPLASEHGADLDRVFYVTLGVTGVLFVMLQLTLAWIVLRFRNKGTNTSGRHPLPKVEHRFALVAGILILGVDITLYSLGESEWFKKWGPAPADAQLIEVTAQQFMWQFRYPGKDGTFGRLNPTLISATNSIGLDMDDPASKDDIVSANELHLAVGRPIRLKLRSKDVIHSFFLPNLRVKQDVVPGMGIEIWFVPTVEGNYEIVCNQLCGMFHHRMRGALVIEKQDDVQAWLAGLAQ